jgi:ankyrin repeat protein
MAAVDNEDDEVSLREALKHHPTDWLNAIKILFLRPDLVSFRQRYRKYTPLHTAILERKPDHMSLLLSLGADPNAKDAFGFTPLATAANADTESVAAVEILLRNSKVEPFPLCGSQGSPLHAAAMRGHRNICQLLTAAANGDAKLLGYQDWRGCTALEVAERHGHDDIAAAIRQSTGTVPEATDLELQSVPLGGESEASGS